MQDPNTHLIIMAGGIGSRFWPFSRRNYPKQFQDILGTGKTLLQQTVRRFEPVCKPENMYIVTNQDYKELVKEQLPDFLEDQILLEPFLRNTAPCIAYASYKIKSKNPEANIIVTPSDHVILDTYSFIDKLTVAIDAAKWSDKIITLGIKPTRPDTGYGYIQSEENQKGNVKKVRLFTEKPNLEMAKSFLDSGDFVWNAGIFIWNAQTITQAFDKYLNDISEAFEEMKGDFYTQNEAKSVEKAYSQFHGISIDYGIMEKADNVYVVQCDCGWSDLGTWKSLHEQAKKDKDKNVITGDVMAYDTKNSIIKTSKDRLTVVQGLDNFIVAEYDNVLLVCHKDQEQRIKDFLETVKKTKNEKYT